ncbi:MAG: serine/threonine-protein kinase [Planctomycetota bacterium]|nr:serine/threonine-protein kinase [Planctomycetota bacterium]
MNFDATALPNIGQTLNGFLIEDQLGQGGMGAVYRVTKNGAIYAMKVLPNSYRSDLVRFEREAIALAAVRHPNIVTIHSFQREGTWAYIIFEFVEGYDLSSKIVPGEPWSLRDTVRLLDPLADALDAVHAQGLIHRDIKPANILIRNRDGAAMLTDFGIAKDRNLVTMTQAGEVVGTINYMAPEQFEGHPVTHQTDLWAFAQVLYELLTGGQQPFQGGSLIEFASSVVSREPTSPREYNPELPAAIDQLTERMFQKDSWDRHSSAAALILDCRRLISGEDIEKKPSASLRSLHQLLIKKFGLKQARFITGTLTVLTIFLLAAATWIGQESWQVHSWEESTKKDIQSLGSKLTVEIQSAPLALPEHLLTSSPLDCCLPIQALQEDRKSLENAIQGAGNKSFLVSKTQKFEEQLNKIQTKLKHLEWIHGLTKLNKSALADFPKRERPLATALWHFRSKQYGEAYQAFQSLSGSSRAWLKPIQFASILSAHRSGNYKATLQLLPNLSSDRSFDKHTKPLIASANMDRSKANLFNVRCSKRELSRSFQSVLQLSKARPSLLDTWNTRILIGLEGWSEDPSKPIEAVVLRHRNLTYQFPQLKALQLNEKLLKHCMASASQRKDTSKALMYFIRLRRLGIILPIVDKFQLAFDSEGRFDASKLSKELALSHFLKSRNINRLLDYCLEAARNGIYLDALDDVEGRILVHDNKLPDKLLKKSPFDPCTKFWKHYSVQDTFSRKELTENIQGLQALLSHPQLPIFYKAMIYEDQAGKLLRREYGAQGSKQLEIQRQISQWLNKALELPHPRPDKLHWKKYELLCWATKQKFSERSPEMLRCLDRYKVAIDDRLQRCRKNELHIGRPSGVPLAKDAEALLLSRVASYHDQRGKLYFKLGDLTKAERDLLISIDNVTNSDTFSKLLTCIRQSKNGTALVKVERLVNIALSDPNRPRDTLKKFRALLSRIKEVKGILGVK